MCDCGVGLWTRRPCQNCSLLPELASIVLRSGANKAYTGSTTLFGLSASCTMLYFFLPDNPDVNLATVQLAAECRLFGTLQPSSIPVISAFDTWLSAFTFSTNATVVFSSASHSAYDASTIRATNAAFQLPTSTVTSLSNLTGRKGIPTFLDRGTRQHSINSIPLNTRNIVFVTCWTSVGIV
jgi:hypothetical protein